VVSRVTMEFNPPPVLRFTRQRNACVAFAVYQMRTFLSHKNSINTPRPMSAGGATSCSRLHRTLSLWGASCCVTYVYYTNLNLKLKLHGLSPRANYTDRATATCQRSDCQLVRVEGATWSA
jgi:hypothetical protein